MPDLDLAHIVFALDRSGSMESLRRMAVDGFNQFLSQQRALPGKVVFALLADGEENSSRRYRAFDVAKRIRHQTDVYGWEFLFMGASASWLEQAREMGIQAAEASAFVPSPDGLEFATREVGERVSESRRFGRA